MVLAVFIFTLILIIPIFISVYLYYDHIDKRLYFAFYFYGVFKISAGYVVKRKRGGYYIHTKNKAYVFDYKALKNIKTSELELASAFLLKTINLYCDIGIKNINLLINTVFVFRFLQNFSKFYTNKYKYLNYFFELNVSDTQNTITKIQLKTEFCFNLLGIVIKLIANLIIKGAKNEKKYAKTWNHCI